MIDINLYRSRIGTFFQSNKHSRIKFRKLFRENIESDRNTNGTLLLIILQSLFKIVLILALLCTGWNQTSDPTGSCSLSFTTYPQTIVKGGVWFLTSYPAIQLQVRGRKQTSNFKAKCVNGNRSKGIQNAHLNIRSLKNKMCEVKNLVKEHSPNILGLSECELNKVNNHFDENKLKIPGYQILFPKSWKKHGFARVVVYN